MNIFRLSILVKYMNKLAIIIFRTLIQKHYKKNIINSIADNINIFKWTKGEKNRNLNF